MEATATSYRWLRQHFDRPRYVPERTVEVEGEEVIQPAGIVLFLRRLRNDGQLFEAHTFLEMEPERYTGSIVELTRQDLVRYADGLINDPALVPLVDEDTGDKWSRQVMLNYGKGQPGWEEM